MNGREYLKLKGVEVVDDYFDGCPSDYGLKDYFEICNEFCDGCSECIKRALESEVPDEAK